MILTRDLPLIKLATVLAEDSPLFGAAKIGAVIGYGSEAIATGCNIDKSHTFTTKYYREGQIYPHAEVVAIRKANRRLTEKKWKKVTLYVARMKKPHKGSDEFIWGLSKPCCGCQQVIEAFGIRRVVWTTDTPGEVGLWTHGSEWPNSLQFSLPQILS